MIFIVVGRPRHGKNTFAEHLSSVTGQKVGDCSNIIYDELAVKLDIPVEKLLQLPKEEIRPQLIDLGNKLIAKDPCYFGRKLINNGHHIICGVRRLCELSCIRKEHMHTCVIWVQNDNAPIVEDNTEITKEDSDIVIFNNGDLFDLQYKATVVGNLKKVL